MHTWMTTRQSTLSSWHTPPGGSKNKIHDQDGGSKTIMILKLRVRSIGQTLVPHPVPAIPRRKKAGTRPEAKRGHGMTAENGHKTGARTTDHPPGGARKDGMLVTEGGSRTHGKAPSESEQESGKKKRKINKMEGCRMPVRARCRRGRVRRGETPADSRFRPACA